MVFIAQGKTNWKFLLIVVILAAIVGGAIWFLSILTPKEPLTSEEPVIPEEEITEPVEDETADWQTYRNEEYGYEIKYPDNFSIDEDYLDYEVTIRKSGYGCISHINVKEQTMEEWEKIIDDQKKSPQIEFVTKEEIFIDNHRAIKYRSAEYEMGLIGVTILLSDESQTYLIGSCEGDNFEETFNQMISTFRFIEEFCGWSTYGECSSDSDCVEGGCSGEVCSSKNDEPFDTTCEWKDCYDDEAYGVECKCLESKCQWTE